MRPARSGAARRARARLVSGPTPTSQMPSRAAARVDDEADGVGAVERAGRVREVGAVEAAGAVDHRRRVRRLDQRPRRRRECTGTSTPSSSRMTQGVVGGAVERGVAGDGRDAEQLGVPGGDDDGDGVVVAGIAVEDDRDRHGVRLPPAPVVSRTIGPIGLVRRDSSVRAGASPVAESVDPAADPLALAQRGHHVGVARQAPRPAAVVEQAGGDRLLRRAVAAVHDGVRLDRRRPAASSPVGQLAAREGVDLVLRVVVAEPLRRRLGAVHAEGVLGGVAAVGPHEAVLAGLLAQVVDDGGDGVHHVVVPRAAGERQAAGAGELAVGRQPERLGAELHGRREARVEVDDRRRRRCRRRRARAPAGRRARSPACGRTCRGWRRTGARGSRCRSAGTPSGRAATPRRSAASTEHMMIAAAMSTSLLEFMYLRYGRPMRRLLGRRRADLLRASWRRGSTRPGCRRRRR